MGDELESDQPAASFSGVRRTDELDVGRQDLGLVQPERADGTPLELLRDRITHKAERREPLPLSTEERPGFSVIYKPAVAVERLEAWQKVCLDKSFSGGINPVKLACICLANLCVEIRAVGPDDPQPEEGEMPGKRIATPSGDLLTFRSKTMLDLLGTDDALEAVQHWYGAEEGDDDATDGPLLIAFGKVITAAGYDEEAVKQDPTRRRSKR